MKNIVLIGMPGCGKTTIGKLLAEELEIPFYDMDEEIVNITGKTIKELFAQGEARFREKETEAARILAQKKGVIISCGGGVIKRPENMEILRSTGTIVFLNRAPEEICQEVNVQTRPLLAEGRDKVFKLYQERISLYVQNADYIIEVQDPFKHTLPTIKKFAI